MNWFLEASAARNPVLRRKLASLPGDARHVACNENEGTQFKSCIKAAIGFVGMSKDIRCNRS